MSNYPLVLDSSLKPLLPCKPVIADHLLDAKKAAVYRRFPFVIILKKEVAAPSRKLTLKIDPGSKWTGFSLLDGVEAVWMMELQHRGSLISKSLEQRANVRRGRRARNTRYRKPGLANNKKPEGWLAPSLMHRVETIMTWVKRLMKFAPIGCIQMELVRFDLQQLENPEISGTEYQQGELAGYEVREYLLEKWGRKCTYCSKQDIPLQVEHIHPKSKGGSNQISNLCLACEPCNLKKGTQDIAQFLSKKPERLKQIQVQAKRPLKDATAVNSTRWALLNQLKATGLPVTTGSGGQTKFNRVRLDLPKTHCVDAACVGEVDTLVFKSTQPLIAICKGQGGRQKAALNKFGYPVRHNPLKPIKGWCSGDLAVNAETKQLGRVNPRSASNSFNFTVQGSKAISVNVNKLRRVHRKDGYTYTFCPPLSINVQKSEV
jgi:5-methylcytosine-specific restriction endonuclease McrA